MMKPDQPLTFRLHYRHVAILVMFFAIFLGLLTPMARELGAKRVLNPPMLLLLLAPWLLAVLILVFDRKSPVKFWLAPLLLSLLAPALAIGHDWVVVESWFRFQTIPNFLVTLAFNVLLIGTFTFFMTEMSPRRCPECKRLAMIPLRDFWGPGARTPNTRWCALCGAKYWRTAEGEWRKERRRTWLDNVKDSTNVLPAVGNGGERPFGSDSRIVAPLLAGNRPKSLLPLSESALTVDYGIGARGQESA
jgi:hypothetical protein